jgi:hypothetical protein
VAKQYLQIFVWLALHVITINLTHLLAFYPHTQIEPGRSRNRGASRDIIYASFGDLANCLEGNIARCFDVDAGVGSADDGDGLVH